MSSQRGMTLIEVLVVVAMASLILVAASAFALPWLGRETMKGAVYDVQTHMQLARIEAVSRNRPCRFVVDSATRQVTVFDGMGTPALIDDDLLYDTTLPDSVAFNRPDVGAPITLDQIGASSSYHIEFNSDGSVAGGVGEIVLLGGEQYGRISVFGAGGTQVEKWMNGAWHVGS